MKKNERSTLEEACHLRYTMRSRLILSRLVEWALHHDVLFDSTSASHGIDWLFSGFCGSDDAARIRIFAIPMQRFNYILTSQATSYTRFIKNFKFGTGSAFLRLEGRKLHSTNQMILNSHGNADQLCFFTARSNSTRGTDRAERCLDSLTELFARYTFHPENNHNKMRPIGISGGFVWWDQCQRW